MKIKTNLLLLIIIAVCLSACGGKGENKDMKKPGKIERITPTCVLVVEINDRIFYAHIEDNSSADAFIQNLNSGGITVNMQDYGNFEKVGALPFELPENDKQITAKPGDIILYNGNMITLYYGENTYNLTKLAKIENITKEELSKVLGDGDVTIKFSLEWGE